MLALHARPGWDSNPRTAALQAAPWPLGHPVVDILLPPRRSREALDTLISSERTRCGRRDSNPHAPDSHSGGFADLPTAADGQGGSRTHTSRVLSARPLPVGLLGRWCAVHEACACAESSFAALPTVSASPGRHRERLCIHARRFTVPAVAPVSRFPGRHGAIKKSRQPSETAETLLISHTFRRSLGEPPICEGKQAA